MLVNLINKYLSEEGKTLDEAIAYETGLLANWSFKRQFMVDKDRDSKGKLYLSSAGKCARQLAYGYHGVAPKGKEIDGRSKMTFFAGDLIEIVIVQLAKLALKKYGGGAIFATGKDQITVDFPVGDTILHGHPDGLYLQKKIIRGVECKSMSSFGYRKFEKGEIDDTYLAQMNVYMDALGTEEMIVIAYNKDSNVLGEKIIIKDRRIIAKCRENLLNVIISTPDKLPPPAYPDVDAKGNYSWRCLYCAYFGHCKPQAEKVLMGRAYKLREGKKEKTISETQQRALTKGLHDFSVDPDILREYLEINFLSIDGKPVKKLSEIKEKDYADICSWLADIEISNKDLKQELRD